MPKQISPPNSDEYDAADLLAEKGIGAAPVVDALIARGGLTTHEWLITGGGIIPPEDMSDLQKQGIGKLFGPGTPTSELIEYIESWAESHLES